MTGTKKLIAALAVVTALLVPPSAFLAPPQAGAYRLSSAQLTSLAAIRYAAARWNVNYYWLLRVAECESGLYPWAYNPSGASGLFQFMPGTYWRYAPQIGEWRSYWNPWAAANVASYMFSRGQSYQWSCR